MYVYVDVNIYSTNDLDKLNVAYICMLHIFYWKSIKQGIKDI